LASPGDNDTVSDVWNLAQAFEMAIAKLVRAAQTHRAAGAPTAD
jgi:hypothetical protein